MANPAKSWEAVKLEELVFFKEDWKMDATLSSDFKYFFPPPIHLCSGLPNC